MFLVPVSLKKWIIQQITWGFAAGLSWDENPYLVAALLAMGNYKSGLINHITVHNNWDTFYLLLWEVLNNKKRHSNNQIHLLKNQQIS